MNRRKFIRQAAPLAAVPFFSNNLMASVVRLSASDAAALMAAPANERALVVIQLNGGNDGLNMVLPLDQYSNLAAARSSILIPDTAALRLGSFQTGLHPAMTGLKSLYDEQRLTVVQGVSYASPNQSHFRSADIWVTGADSNEYLSDGWIGRFLQREFPTFPDGLPSTAMPDPLAIQIGSNLSTALQGDTTNTGQTVPGNFSGSITQLQLGFTNTVTPNSPAGIEAAFLRQQQSFANQYAQAIIRGWNAGTNTQTYAATPSGIPNNALGQQLKLVARLVKGGLKTRIYWVSANGYDTHSNQVDTANKSTGYHARLLQELSDAIRTFQTDLTTMGVADRVMGLTFSEFGRRIIANGSVGTDHGTAAPMFLFGNGVNPTVLGANAVIPAAANGNSQVPLQFDFRQVYRSVLQDWFCLPAADAATITNTNLASSGAVSANACTTAALPLELLRFAVAKTGERDARLTWATASESNVSHFEIQRSTDARYFRKISSVPAKGHSHELVNYESVDANPPRSEGQMFYYRLKMIDFDETFSFSPTRAVNFAFAGEPLTINVFPNPATDGRVTIQPLSGITDNAVTELSLTDLTGRVVLTTFDKLSATSPLTLQLTGLAAGSYVLTVRHEGKQVAQRVVVP
jgi:uncharacterized protein (DUF1501 family)